MGVPFTRTPARCHHCPSPLARGESPADQKAHYPESSSKPSDAAIPRHCLLAARVKAVRSAGEGSNKAPLPRAEQL